MDLNLLLFSVSRILHVGTAIVLVGGTVFMRYILLPSATETLSDADHDRLRQKVVGRWKRVIHGGITLLVLTGFLNYGRIIAARTHRGDPLYNALLGTKILLAFAIFFIASVLVGRSPRFAGMRQNMRTWLNINIVLALLIVAISGFLKTRTDLQAVPAEAPIVPAAAEPALGSPAD